MSRRDLDRKSDVIATGVIRLIEEHQQETATGKIVEGLAEVSTRALLRNRAKARSPFRFRYTWMVDRDCVFGHVPPADGAVVKIYLRRSRTVSDEFTLIHFKLLEEFNSE